MDTSETYFVLSYGNSAPEGVNKLKIEHEDSLDNVLNQPPRVPTPFLQPDDVLDEFLSTAGTSREEEAAPKISHPISCEICGKGFDKVFKYCGHLRVHSKDNLWFCEKCPDVRFPRRQQLVKHALEKHLAKPVPCTLCPMAFDSTWRLQDHILAKHINYRSLKCEQCGKMFEKRDDLKKHQQTHTDVKKHGCSECPAKFKDKSNLKRHMLVHTGEKPYICIGCGQKFQQIASLKRHKQKCLEKNPVSQPQTIATRPQIRQNYCRVCGMTFQYKSALLEHCVRQHTNQKHEKVSENSIKEPNLDDGNTVDDLHEILLAENEYSTLNTNALTNDGDVAIFNQIQQQDSNQDNILQIEFLKEMNQLHSLDDDLFYNDMDFDFQPSNVFNDYDYGNPTDSNSGIFFDFADNGKSLDQDIMSALYHVKAKDLPDELLNVSEGLVKDVLLPEVNSEDNNEIENSKKNDKEPVSVNECATIFESDIDLEESSNLAANLNQLIGENNVQYISTEDDDTFIISLNSAIDAEQLTDMLNIGIEYVDENKEKPEVKERLKTDGGEINNDITTQSTEESNKVLSEKAAVSKIVKKPTVYNCKTCKKKFTKKDNYRSHIATHEPSLRRHACKVCGKRFSYRSTLNKHHLSSHSPRVLSAHQCSLCDKQYKAAWLLKNHIERDHEGKAPFECAVQGCNKKFYKNFDLVVHHRFHFGERFYECDICKKTFPHSSHLRRHIRSTDCTKRIKKTLLQKSAAAKKPAKLNPVKLNTTYQLVPITFVNVNSFQNICIKKEVPTE